VVLSRQQYAPFLLQARKKKSPPNPVFQNRETRRRPAMRYTRVRADFAAVRGGLVQRSGVLIAKYSAGCTVFQSKTEMARVLRKHARTFRNAGANRAYLTRAFRPVTRSHSCPCNLEPGPAGNVSTLTLDALAAPFLDSAGRTAGESAVPQHRTGLHLLSTYARRACAGLQEGGL
jgi:hypothetical protein